MTLEQSAYMYSSDKIPVTTGITSLLSRTGSSKFTMDELEPMSQGYQ